MEVKTIFSITLSTTMRLRRTLARVSTATLRGAVQPLHFYGSVTRDAISIAGIGILDVPFIEADRVNPTGFVVIYDYDVVLGLARFPELNPRGGVQEPGLWQSIINKHLLSRNIFAFKVADRTLELLLYHSSTHHTHACKSRALH